MKPAKPAAAPEAKRPRPSGRRSNNGSKDVAQEQNSAIVARDLLADPSAGLPASAAIPIAEAALATETAAVQAEEVASDESADVATPSPASGAVVATESAQETKAACAPEEMSHEGESVPQDVFAACRHGDERAVVAFLKAVAPGLADDAEAWFDARGESALHHAVHGASEKVLALLLSIGHLPVDTLNARGETALHVACRKGDVVMVAALLEAGAARECRDAGGLTPLLATTLANGARKILGLLLDAGAEVDARDNRCVGALHVAAMRGDASLISWLLDHGADASNATENGTTALMLAAKIGHADCVARLLQVKGPLLFAADRAGCTALMRALEARRAEIAEQLLAAGASVDVVDCAGRSALFHAVLGGCNACLAAVSARGARINVLDEEGRSPLYQACLMDAALIAERLLETGADPNLVFRGPEVCGEASGEGEADEEEGEGDAGGRTCLDEARTCLQACAALGHNGILQALLLRGADANASPGPLAWTALHLCAATGNEGGAVLLLEAGASVSAVDAMGSTARALAQRAGTEAVLALLPVEASKAADEAGTSEVGPEGAVEAATAPARMSSTATKLPPLHAGPSAEAPAEEAEPLEAYKSEWQERDASDSSLLDKVFGAMLHDALQSDHWRVRWEACMHLSKNFGEASGSPAELIAGLGMLLSMTSRDKMPKVFVASLAVFEELLSDVRLEGTPAEEFVACLRGKGHPPVKGACGADAIEVLLDQTDAGGGSSAASSPQKAAVETLCSCVLHGWVPLDDAAWPLLARIDERLRADSKCDRKESHSAAKRTAANLGLLGRWLSAFGLQQSGLFRRALVLPLLLRGISSEHSKVRAAAGDALIQMIALSGGLEDRIWSLLPSKGQKAVRGAARKQQGISLMSAAPCEEDAMPKHIVVSEDARAAALFCVSELGPELWASLWENAPISPNAAPAGAEISKECVAVPVEDSAAALLRAFDSKSWKDRVEGIETLAGRIAAGGGVERLCDCEAEGPLSQYAIGGQTLSALQHFLGGLLSDTVTAVFVAAADLVRLTCGRLPADVAPLLLEPLVPELLARLVDTSKRVAAKASETALEIGILHSCTLSEMVAQCAAKAGAAFAARPATPCGSSNGDGDKSAVARLLLLTRLVEQVQERGCAEVWTGVTLVALGDYAVRSADHRSGDVRKGAVGLLDALGSSGGKAASIAETCVVQIQLAAQQKLGKRPVTGSTRLPTGASFSRPGSRAGSRASGRMTAAGSSTGFNATGSLAGTGRLSTGRLGTASLGGTGRLTTAYIGGTGGGGGMRPPTGIRRPGTGLRPKEEDEESVNSVRSDEPSPDADADIEDGVAFFNLQTSCPGADEVPDMTEGEDALREALPLAEALDEVAIDFVAPLVALFGDGWARCFYSRSWQCRVAALSHLSAMTCQRVEEASRPEVSPSAVAELLDGTMRAVHEGLGDQNVQVYAAACAAVNATVPPFCGVAEGRLLVAHLAPLLRQLCSRMGDTKEVVRTRTTQSIFRILRPPTGNIVNSSAIATLILRNLAPAREPAEGSEPTRNAASRGAATGWICRLAALRDLTKEYHRTLVSEAGCPHPGEWLALKEGLAHSDPMVRHESARLFALVCKVHLKCLGDDKAQAPTREAWVSTLPRELPPKSLAQVRRLLKLPEVFEQDGVQSACVSGKLPRSLSSGSALAALTPWEAPDSLALWAGCAPEALGVLRNPGAGDEKAVAAALKLLSKAVAAYDDKAASRGGRATKAEETFANVCRAIQQALASPAGADRSVFLRAVELCHTGVVKFAPNIASLDINMGLGKTFPVLLERTSTAGAADVKVGVASDKLVQKLAKHPKVGCEAVTKMVIGAVARMAQPTRPLVLLRTLLSDFGLRLCAQRDVVLVLFGAVATQLEQLAKGDPATQGAERDLAEGLRAQLVGVLATCNQFSAETVRYCLSEVDVAQRKLLIAALGEAPDPRLMALGAAAAEQDAESGHAAGSASRVLSRGRGASPLGADDSRGDVSVPRMPLPDVSIRRSRARLPRPEEVGLSTVASCGRLEGPTASSQSQRSLRSDRASTAASTGCLLQSPPSVSASPREVPPTFAGGSYAAAASSGLVAGARPPAPLGLSTAFGAGAGAGPEAWRFRGAGESAAGPGEEGSRRTKRSSFEGRFAKGGEGRDETFGAMMDALSQLDKRGAVR